MPLFGRLLLVARSYVSRDRAQRASRFASTYTDYNSNGGDDDVSSEPSIRKSVFISQSTDVFTNLALEDWFYRNYEFTDRHVLLLWRNDPCVVYGRHQNPWKECNVRAAEKRGIALARRNSGGGTVYHDNGNLNLSFFTPRDRHNRKYNLQIITRALFREWRLKSVIDEHDDIVVEGDYKISGTAAKLGRPNAYHHCTLLVGVDKDNLNLALERKEDDIITNATTSVYSPMKNLLDVNSNIGIDKLITAIGKEYLRTNALVLKDGGYKLLQKQMGFQFINPSEGWFPGLDKLTNDFRSWCWNFGKTPKFTVTRAFEVTAHDGKSHRLNLRLDVQDGIVEEVRMSLPNELASADFDQDASVVTNLCGTRYNHEITDNIIAAIGGKIDTSSTIQAENKSNVMVTQ